MLTEIERFVNWLRRRNPNAYTRRDYRGDLQQFACPGRKLSSAKEYAGQSG